MNNVVTLIALAVTWWAVAGQPEGGEQQALPFSCATFPGNVTEADLIRRFGEDKAKAGPVLGGGAEGEYTPGTVLFGEDPKAKVEVLWKDAGNKSRPRFVWILTRESSSPWRTPEGISIGTDLLTVEKINRRPFRLFGFGFDGSGTVLNWGGGALSVPDTASCRMRMSLQPVLDLTSDSLRRYHKQVIGDRAFSSGHPAMQALNPRVYKMFLEYR